MDDQETCGQEANQDRLNARTLVSSLDPRERSLIHLITQGFSLIQIAGKLGLLLEDVVRLKLSTMKKVSAAHTADLVRIGIYAGSTHALDSSGAVTHRASRSQISK